MKRKSILILLLTILSFFSMSRSVIAIPELHGYLGKNLEVSVWLDTYHRQQMVVNNTIVVSIDVTNYLELYVKNLQLEIDLDYGLQNLNVTLVRNSNLTLTAGWVGGFVRDFDFTPSTPGDLSIRVSADYEYVERESDIRASGHD